MAMKLRLFLAVLVSVLCLLLLGAQENLTAPRLPDLPPIPTVQSDPSIPLEVRQAKALEKWIAFYNQVKDSWTNLNDSLTKLDQNIQSTLIAKDTELAYWEKRALDAESSGWLWGIGGAVLGGAAGYGLGSLP